MGYFKKLENVVVPAELMICMLEKNALTASIKRALYDEYGHVGTY